jgi:hypothetical protein
MHDVAEIDVRGFLQPASAEDYWTYATEVLAGAVAGLAAADDAARDRIRAAVLGEARSWRCWRDEGTFRRCGRGWPG